MNLTGLVVSYNTKELLQKAIQSIRKFYPELPLLIVDGSTYLSDCHKYVKALSESDPNIERIYVAGNIGHGKGMDRGIRYIKTKYVLLFDSDIEMIEPCLELMLESWQLRTKLYGVGQVIQVDKNGTNDEGGFPYLHPHFCIIDRKQYFNFHPFIHHGAPLIKAMINICRNGHLLALSNFKVFKFVTHKGKGTRNLNPPEFLQNWDRQL